MGLFKKAAVVVAVVTAFAGPMGQGGAFGACATPNCLPERVLSDGIVTLGTGTITPGLATLGLRSQTSVTFDSVLLVEAGDEGVSASGLVHFEGASDGGEDLTQGRGHGTLSGSLVGTVYYERTASIVTLSGTVSDPGDPVPDTLELGSACIFVPNDFNPVTSYELLCAAVTESTDGN